MVSLAPRVVRSGEIEGVRVTRGDRGDKESRHYSVEGQEGWTETGRTSDSPESFSEDPSPSN